MKSIDSMRKITTKNSSLKNLKSASPTQSHYLTELDSAPAEGLKEYERPSTYI